MHSTPIWYLITVYFIFCSTPISGQSTPNKSTLFDRLDYQVGVTPSALLNLYHGVQVRQSISLVKSFRLGMESGWIFYYEAGEGHPSRGFRLRPSIDYIIPTRRMNTSHRVGLFYNIRQSTTYIQIEEFRAGGIYKEIIRGTRKNYFHGPGVYYGYIQTSGVVRMETGAGLGVGRYYNVYDPESLVPGDNAFWRWNVLTITEPSIVPIVILHFSIYVSFSKDK